MTWARPPRQCSRFAIAACVLHWTTSVRAYDIMTRLQALPIDHVKLDATVTGAGVDAARTEAMSQAVLDICRRIGLSVIALGIATARQATALQTMGCELGQGELYGPLLRLERVAKKRA